MDDTTAGARLKTLQEQITQLQASHDQLTDTLNAQPAPPPVATLEHLASYLPQLLTTARTATERKAAVEALIHEIKITEKGLIPVYRIPAPDSPIPGPDSDTTTPRFAQCSSQWS